MGKVYISRRYKNILNGIATTKEYDSHAFNPIQRRGNLYLSSQCWCLDYRFTALKKCANLVFFLL